MKVNASHTWKRWLTEHTERVLRAPKPGRPNLRVVRWESGLAVAKDYLDARPVHRAIGRRIIGREVRIYRRLEGCPGIARVLARPLPELLILEYLPGRDLRHIATGDLPADAVPQLERILTAMHRRGVAHFDLGHDHTGDLGRETNLIWTDDTRLFVVDLAGAITWRGAIGRTLCRVAQLHDRLAVIKIKNRFFPALMGPDDDAVIRSIPAWGWRLLRRMRKL